MAAIPVIIYGAICFFMYLYQEKLLFFPRPTDPAIFEKMANTSTLERLRIQTSDGNTLDGWMQTNPKATSTILYFGGNAEDSSFFVGEQRYENANIISFNYRGYGDSTGKPSESALFSDAIAIYEYLVTVRKTDPGHLVVMGRSLGSGVAAYLASQKPVKRAILVTPYDSIESVARDAYGFMPVSLLLRNKFESVKYASLRQNALLCIYGGRDTLVTNPHTERLIASWNGPVQKLFLPGADHDSIVDFDGVRQAVEGFIK